MGNFMKRIRPIYLDYNATIPLDPHVLKAMHPYFLERIGIPSSNLQYGKIAKEAVNEASYTKTLQKDYAKKM